MAFLVRSAPHIIPAQRVSTLMQQVLLALLPGIAVSIGLFGWAVLIQITIISVAGLLSEALMLRLRGRSLRLFLTDGSVLVTAWLLALALPPLAPWWLGVIGISFAVVIAKHLYGGLGYNVFNPAMVAYAVLLISFPLEMSRWPLPDTGLGWAASVEIIISGTLLADGLTGATALDTWKTQLKLGQAVSEINALPAFGYWASRGWEWCNLAFLLGGVWLLYRRVADWRITVSMLLSLTLCATGLYFFDPQSYASPTVHLFAGASILGAFFIATDPVSASTTPRGRLIYGAGIGVLIYVIRVFGGYPDGVAFAVLLMNCAAPAIDYCTQPKAFGAPS